MNQGFFEGFIKRSDKKLLTTNIIVLAIVLILFVVSFKDFYYMFSGPSTVSSGDIAAFADSGSYRGNYVTLSGNAVFDSGIGNFLKFGHSDSQGQLYEKFFLMLVGDNRVMVVKAPKDHVGDTFTGRLTAIDNEINDRLKYDAAAAGIVILPLMLDSSFEYTTFYLFFGVLVLFLFIGVRNLFKYVKRRKDPACHPVNKALGEFGDSGTVAAKIEEEMGSGLLTIKSFLLTKNWCVHTNLFSLELAKMEDILQVYMQKIRNKQKISYKVLIAVKKGKTITDTFAESELQKVYDLMDSIREKNPEVKTGEI